MADIIKTIIPNICTINTNAIPINKNKKRRLNPKAPRPTGITIQYGLYELDFK